MSGCDLGRDGGCCGAHHKGDSMDANGPHLGKMEEQLKGWGRRLDEYAVAASEATGETRAELGKHVVELRSTYEAAQSRLDELKTRGKDGRDIVMHGLQRAWNKVETSCKQFEG